MQELKHIPNDKILDKSKEQYFIETIEYMSQFETCLKFNKGNPKALFFPLFESFNRLYNLTKYELKDVDISQYNSWFELPLSLHNMKTGLKLIKDYNKWLFHYSIISVK